MAIKTAKIAYQTLSCQQEIDEVLFHCRQTFEMLDPISPQETIHIKPRIETEELLQGLAKREGVRVDQLFNDSKYVCVHQIVNDKPRKVFFTWDDPSGPSI